MASWLAAAGRLASRGRPLPASRGQPWPGTLASRLGCRGLARWPGMLAGYVVSSPPEEDLGKALAPRHRTSFLIETIDFEKKLDPPAFAGWAAGWRIWSGPRMAGYTDGWLAVLVGWPENLDGQKN